MGTTTAVSPSGGSQQKEKLGHKEIGLTGQGVPFARCAASPLLFDRLRRHTQLGFSRNGGHALEGSSFSRIRQSRCSSRTMVASVSDFISVSEADICHLSLCDIYPGFQDSRDGDPITKWRQSLHSTNSLLARKLTVKETTSNSVVH